AWLRRGSRRLPRRARRHRTPRLFLRFPARVVSRGQPPATRTRVLGRCDGGAAAHRAGAVTVSDRRSGMLIPLFAVPSDTMWGIGDIGDLRHVVSWLAAAGQRVLQLLPINEMAPGQQSPYSAISAMAIDPIYLDVAAIPEFVASGGLNAFTSDELTELERVRKAPSIQYQAVRRLKEHALRIAADRFITTELRRSSSRAQSFAHFLDEQAWWLDDYVLFRAIHATEEERPWTAWPASLRRRETPALADAKYSLVDEVTFRQYIQWI